SYYEEAWKKFGDRVLGKVDNNLNGISDVLTSTFGFGVPPVRSAILFSASLASRLVKCNI
ncbi:MAG: hypothetical protein ACHBN1_04995, partial [Heteroscytonema crispum UTEX LB 1556]